MDLAHDGTGHRAPRWQDRIRRRSVAERARPVAGVQAPADLRRGIAGGDPGRLAGSGDSGLRAFRRMRRVFFAALVARRAARRQAAPAARQSGAHRPRQAATRAFEPLRGPAVGYRRRARLGVKYVHKKGTGAGGISRTGKALLADLRRCEVLSSDSQRCPRIWPPWSRATQLAIPRKLPQAEVAAGDDTAALVFRVMADAQRRRISTELVESFGQLHSAVAIYPADRRPRHHQRPREPPRRWLTTVDGGRVDPRVRTRPISFR